MMAQKSRLRLCRRLMRPRPLRHESRTLGQIWYATLSGAAHVATHILDGPHAPVPPGAARAPSPHVPAYLVGNQDGRRELLDIFAQHSARADECAAVGAAFARLAPGS